MTIFNRQTDRQTYRQTHREGGKASPDGMGGGKEVMPPLIIAVIIDLFVNIYNIC